MRSLATAVRKRIVTERERLAARVRGRVHWELSERSRTPPDHPPPDYLHFIPEVRSDEELSALSARVAWYLPDRVLPIFVGRASDFEVEAEAAPYMDRELVRDPGWERHRPRGRPHVVLHSTRPRQIRPYLASSRATIADAALSYGSERGFFALGEEYSPVAVPSAEVSVSRLLDCAPGASSAFLLATGPSAGMVDPKAVSADVRITCNSAVRDARLLADLSPDAIAFSDRVFHFGPSRYAGEFRRDLLRAAEKTDALFLTTDLWVWPLLARHPELADRFVVLPAALGGPWAWPAPGRAAVRSTGNILTILMLPAALALADRVTLAGCDGRKPDEGYFWQHNKQTQYSDELMQTAFAAHPAFFRDVSYDGYYGRHVQELDDLLTAAEAAGKTIDCQTPSHIPALLRRGAPRFPPDES